MHTILPLPHLGRFATGCLFACLVMNIGGVLSTVHARSLAVNSTARFPHPPAKPTLLPRPLNPALAPSTDQLPVSLSQDWLSVETHQQKRSPSKTLSLIGSDEDPFVRLAQAAGQPAPPPTTPGEPDLALMAQKANNPLSDVWLLFVQNDTSLLAGDLVPGNKTFNSLKIQPVMPFPILNGEWNLIFRPVLQVVSSPIDEDVGELFGASPDQVFADPDRLRTLQDPFGRTDGLGDSALLTLLGPNRTDGFIWGGGFSQIFPTATEDVLGQGKWQMGPAAIALLLGDKSGGLGIDNWNLGFLLQQWFSYAGDDDRRSTSQMDIQYFINWRMNDTQLIGMTPNIRINWKEGTDNAVSFPIGLGTIGMFKIGPLPFRWGVEAQYYAVRPDSAGADWNFKVFLAPVISNPFK